MSEFWFPHNALHKGHAPAWMWFIPPLWLVLVPVYLIWLVGLAVLFVFVALPVNLVRAFTRRPAAR